jgi:hypothetical protein
MTFYVNPNKKGFSVPIDSSDQKGDLKTLRAERFVVQKLFESNTNNLATKQYWIALNDDQGKLITLKQENDPFKQVDTAPFEAIWDQFNQEFGSQINGLDPAKRVSMYKRIREREIERITDYLFQEVDVITNRIRDCESKCLFTTNLMLKLENLVNFAWTLNCFSSPDKP